MADRYWVGTNTIRSFSVAAQEANPTGLFFKPDGLKMYVVGTTGDDVNEYDLSSAWDVSTASYLQNFSVSAQESSPSGLFFKSDGTKMYMVGSTGDAVNEYDLSSAWDVSSASYLQNFSVSAQETLPNGLFFKPDGLKMYVIGSSGDDVNEYDLSSAWDVSSASYLQNFSVSAQENAPQDVFFKPDGTKMYVIGSTGDDVNEYTLSSAWDVSTASYLQNFSVAAQETTPASVFFKDDGTVMYIIGVTTDSVFSYPLSSAWDISSINPDVWDGTAGTKWATTSGGAGGASVPTTADDVFFDANSTGVVTIAAGNTGAKSINCTGFTGTITGSANITVAGSVTLDAGQTYTHTGTMTFTGTGTLTTAGKTFSGVTVNGSGITLTLGDALTLHSVGQVLVSNGSFVTSNYNVTARGFGSANNTNARSIDLGSSNITVGAGDFFLSGPTNLTFISGTSQINLTLSSSTLSGGSQTFYNVSFTATSAGTRSISGANTFNNLTLNVGQLDTQGLTRLSLGDDQTVNGSFTCAGFTAVRRGFVSSNTIGTTRTITAAAVSANDCDFRDITIAGAAAPISPTRAGDCGGNSGITFPAAKTAYRVGTNTSWTGSSSWATTSGGTGSNDNFPLSQDTAVIDDNTALTGTLRFFAAYNVGAIDASARTTGITLEHSTPQACHGSYTLGSGVTVSGTSDQTFSGRGTMVFTSAGKTITFPITVNTPSGTFQLGDAFSSSSSITHTRGTFDANDYNLTATRFASNDSTVRTITMGSGVWALSAQATVTGSAPWVVLSTNLTFNKDTADIVLSGNTTAARSFFGGGLTYNKLTIGGATETSTTQINDTNSFTELASTKTVAHTVRFSANQNTIDTWSITGSAGNVVTVDSSFAGIRRTFNLTNVTSGIDYLNVKDIGVTDANRFYVGANSTDSGNNLNVYFTNPPSLQSTGNFFSMFY